MDNKMVYGFYDSGDAIMNSVKKVRAANYNIQDCYTPYPVHGLDKAMGIKRSRLPIGAFICGAIGAICGISLQVFTSVFDWPMIIGGKPFLHIPTYIPVTFELTILFTAFGIGILFFMRAKMLHGVREDIIDRRQTNDRLIIAVETNENTDVEALNKLLVETGAIEIRESEESSK